MVRDRGGFQVCGHSGCPLAAGAPPPSSRAAETEGGTPPGSRPDGAGGGRLSPSNGLPVAGPPRSLRLRLDVPLAHAAVDSGRGIQGGLSRALAALPQAARDPAEVDLRGHGAREGAERGGGTGPNPTDRPKLGVKRHVLTDGRGVPLSVVTTPANVYDKWMVGDVCSMRWRSVHPTDPGVPNTSAWTRGTTTRTRRGRHGPDGFVPTSGVGANLPCAVAFKASPAVGSLSGRTAGTTVSAGC